MNSSPVSKFFGTNSNSMDFG
jgi:hypothetical protein